MMKLCLIMCAGEQTSTARDDDEVALLRAREYLCSSFADSRVFKAGCEDFIRRMGKVHVLKGVSSRNKASVVGQRYRSAFAEVNCSCDIVCHAHLIVVTGPAISRGLVCWEEKAESGEYCSNCFRFL
jgi:hypothetical protein